MGAEVIAPVDTDAALLAKLGVCDQTTARQNTFARVLLLAPPKSGKTTAIAGTAPKPLIINCDGTGATKGATNVHETAKFLQLDVLSGKTRQGWKAAIAAAQQLVAKGLVRTIAVDTLTTLQANLLDELSATLEGFDKWNAIETELVGGLKKLMNLEAHLFITAHLLPAKDEGDNTGVLPSIKGGAKISIPALLDDVVLMAVNLDGPQPKRQFVLGPQKAWSYSGRNIKKSCVVEASIPALFGELGIDP